MFSFKRPLCGVVAGLATAAGVTWIEPLARAAGTLWVWVCGALG
jgi:hypothetical protein